MDESQKHNVNERPSQKSTYRDSINTHTHAHVHAHANLSMVIEDRKMEGN